MLLLSAACFALLACLPKTFSTLSAAQELLKINFIFVA